VRRQVCFLTYRETLGPIFSSVYLMPAEELTRKGYEVSLLCFSSVGEFVKPALRRRFAELRADVEQRIGCTIRRLPTRSNAWDDSRVDRALIRVAAKCWSGVPVRGVLHTGGSRAVDLALTLRRKRPDLKIVYHVWGPEAAEYMFGAQHRGEDTPTATFRADRLHTGQARAMREADAVICISETMKQWAIESFDVCPRKVSVMPCFCDAVRAASASIARDTVRRALGYSADDFVVAYCGSMLSWQLSPKAIRVLRLIQELGAQVKFLGLTMHVRSLERRVLESGFPAAQSHFLTVPHREVAGFLAAADLGILGRNLFEPQTLVSRVSSPIKFGEYLAAGTPVVLGEGIGDFSALTRAHRLGVVMPESPADDVSKRALQDHIAEYQHSQMTVRERCQRFAREYLDVRNWVASLDGIYQRL